MGYDKLKKWATSIYAIIIAFIVFFPVGFVLIYIRLKTRRGSYYAITKELYYSGLVWFFLGLLYLGLSTQEKDFVSTYLPASIFAFIIPGLIAFYFGYKRNKRMKVYDKYMPYLLSRKKVKIDGLCNSVGIDYDSGIKVLEEMISKGFIEGYISDDELIITRKVIDDQEINNEYEVDKEVKIVKCKDCGAKNTVIVGQTAECEYCGSKLN